MNDLNTMKGEFNLKLTRLKLMEMELYREKRGLEEGVSEKIMS